MLRLDVRWTKRRNEMYHWLYVCFTFDVRLNGVLEGKCYMAAQKAAFIVSGRICGGTWAFISVKVPLVQ